MAIIKELIKTNLTITHSRKGGIYIVTGLPLIDISPNIDSAEWVQGVAYSDGETGKKYVRRLEAISGKFDLAGDV